MILWLPILARVWDLGIAKAFMPLRKELGILMGTLALVHSLIYIIPFPSYIFSRDFWIFDGYITAYVWGFFAMILTLPLLLTSNNYAIKKLGRYWKTLHKLVYIIVIFTVVHVVVLKFAREFEIWPVILLCLYFIWKTLEWKGISFQSKNITYSKGQKWICPPCGFIYDPVIWDRDSGIAPGTEFVDIPADWSCPECGVKKSDFIPYDASVETVSYPAKVVSSTYLNPTTLELTVELSEHLDSRPGQFITFLFEDETWVFTRQYSIVEQEWERYTFTIKLTELGRWARLLRSLKKGMNLRISWIYGDFGLRDTSAPKIFIGTGTGLAPLYNMISSLPIDVKKSLYFSVSTGAEVFYREKLWQISNLELHIHVTRENIEWYETGRVDINTIDASPETEWYFCGNPQMVSDGKKKLTERGFTKIYSEEFN